MEVRDTRRLMASALLLACGLAACAKPPPGEWIPFSETLRVRQALTDAELRGLQFAISHQIVLERAVDRGTHDVARGRLILRGDLTIHQVVIRPGTLGRIEPPAFVGEGERGHVIEVSFERGAPLRFAPWEPGGAYTLEAPARTVAAGRSFMDFWSVAPRPRRFDVLFESRAWTVEAGAAAHLQVEADAVAKLRRTRRVLPGVRVPEAR